MLPSRLMLIRNIRGGCVWLHARWSSSKDGGDKMSGSHIENANDTNNQNVQSKVESKQKETKEERSRVASQTLNALLHSMLKEENTRATPSNTTNLALTKAKQRNKEKKVAAAAPILDVDVVEAVARELGGDEMKTQAELVNKLVEAVDMKQDASRVKPTKAPINLSALIVGMKIDRTAPAPSSRAHHVRRTLEQRAPHSVSASMLGRTQQRHQESGSPAGLNDGTAFGIFASGSHVSSEPNDDVWSQLQQRELRLAVAHPPANIFEEMMLWTNQGKLWNFPIDNEQGLEAESNVPFSQHVFLEQHIEDWCPKRGPVRHFMELVCVGLSKNPYMTVQEKREHIEWYREYFDSKQALLKEVGAIL